MEREKKLKYREIEWILIGLRGKKGKTERKGAVRE